MAKPSAFFLLLILSSLYIHLALSTIPEPSPSPAADSPHFHSPSPALPPSSDSPISSPPAPPPSSDPPTPGAAPTSANSPGSDVPAPSPGGINHSNNVEASDTAGKGSSGMSGGKKAGIVFGVLIAAGLIVVGGFVYKKRQDNERRSQYGNAARRDLL